jgi:hypothetical protein
MKIVDRTHHGGQGGAFGVVLSVHDYVCDCVV